VNKPNTGIYLELFAGLPDIYYKQFLDEGRYGGMFVSVTDQDHFPIRKKGQTISTGSYVSIEMSLTHYENQPPPYSPCVYPNTVDTPVSRAMLKHGFPYDRLNCLTYCQEKQILDQGGCWKLMFPNIFDAPYLCDNLTSYNRLWELYYNTIECQYVCPAECILNVYDLQVSSADFPTANYAYESVQKRLDFYTRLFETENITYDMFERSISSVFIYFNSFVQTDVIEAPIMALVDLVAYVGLVCWR
jgi:hypothetical protein